MVLITASLLPETDKALCILWSGVLKRSGVMEWSGVLEWSGVRFWSENVGYFAIHSDKARPYFRNYQEHKLSFCRCGCELLSDLKYIFLRQPQWHKTEDIIKVVLS